MEYNFVKIMKWRVLFCCVMILLISLADETCGSESQGEYWAQKMIQRLKGNGFKGDPVFLTDFEPLTNQLKVWNDNVWHGWRHKERPDPHSDNMYQFFHLKQLKAGNVIPFFFRSSFKTYPPFITKSQADGIPFSTHEIPGILAKFGLRQDSKEANAVEEALTDCETKPYQGVTMFCATSLESMMDNVRSFFGPNKTKAMKVVATSELPPGSKPLQNYTITSKPRKLAGGHGNMLACHLVPYPYALYYCHEPEGRNVAWEVSLIGADGAKVEAIASCHLDTKAWNTTVPAFSFLGTKPGAPVCHVLPHDDLVWVV